MCNKCNSNLNNPYMMQQLMLFKQQQNAQAGMQTAYVIMNGASTLLSMIFSNFSSANSVDSYSDNTSVNYVEKYANNSKEEVVEDPKETKIDITKSTDAEIKTEIEKLLKNRVTNLDNATLDELVTKYRELKTKDPNYSDHLLTLRLQNFVLGKINQDKLSTWSKKESELMQASPNAKPKAMAQALSNNTEEKEIIDLKKDSENIIDFNKLKNLSLQVMSYADSNNNEKIDLVEFFRKDLISHYQISGNLNINDATTKADEQLKELNIKTSQDVMDLYSKLNANGVNNLSGEEMILMSSVMQFDTLNQNEDPLSLDLNELMAYHATVANFNTADNKIDKGDYSLFNSSMTTEIKERLEDGTVVNKTENDLKFYYDAVLNYKPKS